MRKTPCVIIVLILLFCRVPLFGQFVSVNNSFIGHWELRAVSTMPDATCDSIYGYLNLEQDHTYNILPSKRSDSDNLLESGSWMVRKNGKQLVLSERKYETADSSEVQPDISYKVVSAGDDILKLKGYYNGRKATLLYLDVFAPQPYPGMRNCRPENSLHFYLVNSEKPKKEKLLTDQAFYTLGYNWIPQDTTGIVEIHTELDAHITGVQDSVLTFSYYHRSDELKKADGSSILMQYDLTNDRDSIFSLRFEQIEFIHYQSYTSDIVHGCGTFISFLSALDILVVAPLASIRYREGGFNTDRYFSMAAYGLTGLGIGIPLTIFSRGKTYYTACENETNKKNSWNIILK